ncbi:MAG: hypothetical protein ACI90V_003824, partial [Bacillariaceae sp.]
IFVIMVHLHAFICARRGTQFKSTETNNHVKA